MQIRVAKKRKITFYATEEDYRRLVHAMQQRALCSPSKFTLSTFFHEFLETLPEPNRKRKLIPPQDTVMHV